MSVVAFIVEWFDQNAAMVRSYRVNFYDDGTLDMINKDTKMTFLKRTYCESVKRQDLHLGASITVFGRQLHLVSYADEGTRLHFEGRNMRPFVLVKPSGLPQLGQIVKEISKRFCLTRMKMIAVEGATCERFGCSPGVAVAIEASYLGDHKENLAGEWLRALEPHSQVICTSVGQNGDAHDDAADCFARASYFGSGPERTACVVKPHVVQDSVGDFLTAITDSGYDITALEMLHLDRTMATQFFGVYKGVLPQYADMIEEVVAGRILFLQLQGPNVVEEFRALCGPVDVEIAQAIRPNSLRARFGIDRVKNAVHCTDLPTDGLLECEYFRHLTQM